LISTDDSEAAIGGTSTRLDMWINPKIALNVDARYQMADPSFTSINRGIVRRRRERVGRSTSESGSTSDQEGAANPSRVLLLGDPGRTRSPGTLGERLSSRRVRTPYGLSSPVHLYERTASGSFSCPATGARVREDGAVRELPGERLPPRNGWESNGSSRGRGPAPSSPVPPRGLVLPDDLLDFTRNRPSTFYEGRDRLHPAVPRVLRNGAQGPPERVGPARRGSACTSAGRTPAPKGRAWKPPPRSGSWHRPGRTSSG